MDTSSPQMRALSYSHMHGRDVSGGGGVGALYMLVFHASVPASLELRAEIVGILKKREEVCIYGSSYTLSHTLGICPHTE